MGFKTFIKSMWSDSKTEITEPKSSSVAYQDSFTYGYEYPIITKKWDGEKTLGELGIIIKNIPDFKRLSLRSYHAYTTIDTVKIIASKYFYWTIGSGLKLQAEPERKVLQTEGIVNSDDFYNEFQKTVESRFLIYANSKQCDYNKEKTLHELALDFYQGSFLGGDTLAVCRFDDNGPNVQFISGDHIENPDLSSTYYLDAEKNKNYIEHGVEIDSKGSVVAYYVKKRPVNNGIATYERIPAIGGKSKKRLAWLISSKKISPDHLRSVPAMSQSLEKINKLDRYIEAAVTKAEQGAKINFSIEHDEYSTGEDPLDQIVKQKRSGIRTTDIDEKNDRILADGLANRLTETTAGMAINMPNGAKLKSFESSIETNVPEFHGTIFNSIAAGVNVPPEVAMQSYNSNYSASRAAINSFGYIISVDREKFANDFYIPFYKLWLEHQILNNKIKAPGYIENINNFMVIESYTQCRFMGKNMPHIDPLKEIKAIREMLGVDGATPLISREQAVEMLGAGQWDENLMKYIEEEKMVPKQDIVPTDNTKQPNNNN